MRLKTFNAPTLAEALAVVRTEMGEDAIIVSTQRVTDGGGTRVTAALEEADFDGALDRERHDGDPLDVAETIRQALAYHGTPPRLAERLVQIAGALAAEDPTLAFAGAVDAGFAFSPLSDLGAGEAIMLVGPPGSGKTITTAKLAARATLDELSVEVITTDTQRAGGIEQLEAFTRILGLELETPDTVAALGEAVAAVAGRRRVLIDTQGTNPFSEAEMDHLEQLIRAARGEPVLVMAAGGDAMEAADIAASFATIGVGRLLVTRLDMARRLGAILAAADAARLTFCEVSITPHIADGLSPINPVSLARLIMPHTLETDTTAHVSKVAS